MQLRNSAGSSLIKCELMSFSAICAAALIGSLLAGNVYGAQNFGAVSIKASAPTNQVTLDAVVADVLEHNPELNFYSAEIAAAKGEAQTAATWANPELSTTIGGKRVDRRRSGGGRRCMVGIGTANI